MELNNFFSKAKKTANYVADVAGKKSKEVYETSKSSVKILEFNSDIDALYKEIGKLVYEARNGAQVSEDIIIKKTNEITQKHNDINNLRSKKDTIKNTVICPNCKMIGRKDEVFCGGCGIKF